MNTAHLWTTNKLTKKEPMTFVKLYTSPTCSACPSVKKSLDEAGINYELRDVSDPEARSELFSLGVRAVPYLVAENRHGSEYKALGTGINPTSLQEFLNA